MNKENAPESSEQIVNQRGFVSNHRAGENYLNNVQKQLKELEWI